MTTLHITLAQELHDCASGLRGVSAGLLDSDTTEAGFIVTWDHREPGELIRHFYVSVTEVAVTHPARTTA